MSGLPPLVDAATLAERIDDPSLRIFDTTVLLQRPPGGGPYAIESGRAAYEQGHVPGAAFADIPGALSDPASRFPFTVPSTEHFAAAAGRLGIGPGVHVVAYTHESPMWATRFWWLLRFFGFDAVSVLDGGLGAWVAGGYELRVGAAEYPPVEFDARRRPELLASRRDVEAVVAEPASACLVNALQPPVFRGEGPSSYSRPGRIPQSINIPWTALVDPDTNLFRPLDEIERHFGMTGSDGSTPVIAYCGGGISATVDLFALSLLGRDTARLYDGSLTEWTADPSLPVEVG
jgi:thiosulfate/3-mercaptopyruvate sulfurtransferase